MDTVQIAKALSSETRVRVLGWLKDHEANFESRQPGDLGEEGVCGTLIAAKAGISQPTTSKHLDVLRRVGLIKTTRVGGFNLHRSDEEGLGKAKEVLNHEL